MVLDIVAVVVLLLGAYYGWLSGFTSQFWRVVGLAGAFFGAMFVSRPAARYIITGIDWPERYATGIVFVSAFGVMALAFWFFLERLVQSVRQNEHDGTILDRAMGALAGIVRFAGWIFAILCGAILITQHLGAKKASWAVGYHTSRVGRFVLTHNPVDTEPFPNARVIRGLLDLDTQPPGDVNALGLVRNAPEAAFLKSHFDGYQYVVRSQNWKSLRRDRALLGLACSHVFLNAAEAYLTPKHVVGAEEPTDRFKELRPK